jgi:hypothetical protein
MLRPRMLVLVALELAACGGTGARAGGDGQADLDADPFALLPASAIVVASFDARAIDASGAVGKQVASMADSLVPLGPEAGLQVSRDVDRVVAAGYGSGDVAAVLSGRFDEAGIDQATTAKNGTPIVRGTYAGRTTHTVGPVSYAVLTPHTLVAGTSDGLRQVLDRIHGGTLRRAVPPWVVDTLQTQGAEMALAADFATQPIASAAVGSLKMPWLDGLHVARVVGNLEPGGMNVAATLTYADAVRARTAADGVKLVDRWLAVVGPLLGGLTLRDMKVELDGADVRCSFAVDDHALSSLLGLASRLLPASVSAGAP